MAKDRSTVPANLKWRVEDIFANTDEWNALYAECESELDFSEFEGKLDSVENVLACMTKLNTLILKLNKLAIYAHIRHDEVARGSLSSEQECSGLEILIGIFLYIDIKSDNIQHVEKLTLILVKSLYLNVIKRMRINCSARFRVKII